MPAIPVLYDPDNKRTNELGDTERKQRLALIDAYWKYYNGEHKAPLKGKGNVIVNLSGQAIDKAVAFFAHETPHVQLPGGSDLVEGPAGRLVMQKTPEQEALEALLAANDFDEMLPDIGLSGFVGGHVFVRLYQAEPGVRLALLDPRFVTAFWNESNIQETLFYRLTWTLTMADGKTRIRRQDIVPNWLLKQSAAGGAALNPDLLPEAEEGWTIIEFESRDGGGRFEALTKDAWMWPFGPVVEWKNRHAPHQYYGQSDLKHADLNDAVNFVASNIARIIKHHGGPKTIVIGADMSQIVETSIEGIFTLPSGATVTNLEMQSDLASSLNMLNYLETTFYGQMRVVNLQSHKDKIGQLTNFGLRVLYKDMLDATTSKQQIYGRGLGEVFRRALWMLGREVADRPRLTWADPLPENRKERVEAIEIEKKLGFTSDQTLAIGAGRDYEQEQEQIAEESGKRVDNVTNVLQALAEGGGLP